MNGRTAACAPTRPFGLDEVQAAVRALQAGQFRAAHPSTQQVTGSSTTNAEPTRPGRERPHRDLGEAAWAPEPGERVVAVVGSAGSTGASALALAIALNSTSPARVVECCSASASGLAAASTAELGHHPAGWRQGKREQVLIERAGEVLASVDEVPAPTTAAHEDQLTILDIGWEIGQVVATDSWVTDALATADQVVVVTTSTVPGMRRLEGTLDLLLGTQFDFGERPGSQTSRGAAAGPEALAERTWVAVLGPRRKKWPRGVEHAGGPAARRALSSWRVVEIPEDRGLAVHGLDSRPVPPALLSAAARLLTTRTPALPEATTQQTAHHTVGEADSSVAGGT